VEGEDVDLRDRRGFTPLHFAAQAGSVDVARLLLDSGAEIDPTNDHGNTPLWTAVFNSRGAGEVIVLLRGRGSDPFARNKAGTTPYDLAMLIDNYDIARFFRDLEDRG
jgi:ankyrin repeat protein